MDRDRWTPLTVLVLLVVGASVTVRVPVALTVDVRDRLRPRALSDTLTLAVRDSTPLVDVVRFADSDCDA